MVNDDRDSVISLYLSIYSRYSTQPLVYRGTTAIQSCHSLLDGNHINWKLGKNTLQNVGVDIGCVWRRLDRVVRDHVPE
jgi:hypothetical protein